MKQFVIVGLGRFGTSVAKTLIEKGHQVIGVDMVEELVENMSENLTQCVQVDATDEKALASVGIDQVDAAIVAIGDDLEASILVTLILKEMGIKEIIAKATNETHARVLKKLGATRIVFPERDMGIRVANSLSMSEVIEHIELSEDCSIVEMHPPAIFVGKSLKQLDIRANYNLNVVAIRRKIPKTDKKGNLELKDDVTIVPSVNEIINKNDILIIIGENENLENLKNI